MEQFAAWLPHGLAVVSVLSFALVMVWPAARRRVGKVPALSGLAVGLTVAGTLLTLDVLDEREKASAAAAAPKVDPATVYRPMPAPPAGSPAPDVPLRRADTGQPIRLKELVHERPVVLVFGSFGCPYFCAAMPDVRRLYTHFKNRADFVLVYVNNAHTEPPEVRAAAGDPTDRAALAHAGSKIFGIDFPCVLDSPDGAGLVRYGAYPGRLVIVDPAGRVGFDSGEVVKSGLDPVGAEDWLNSHAPAPVPLP